MTKSFYVNAAIRAVKTFAQAAVALLVGVTGGLIHANWTAIGSVAGMAAVVSVFTSFASADQVADSADIAPVAVPKAQGE